MVTSRYVQLSDWLLLEYIYTANQPDDKNFDTSSVGVYKISNNITGEYQFVNLGTPNNGIHPTGNCLDWSMTAVNSTQSKWASTKIGSGNNIFSVNSDIVLSDISDNMQNIHYDTIKVHILSGYNFEGLDGFGLEIIFKENSKKDFKAGSYCFSADLTTQGITFNPTPIILAEKMYDKYLSFSIPSLQFVQNEYWQNPSNTYNLGYHFSHVTTPENNNPGGYLKDSPILINLIELVNVTNIDDIDYFDIRNKYSASIQSSDSFSNLGCTIKESSDGDYFEYYPTWQGLFIDNYIANINSTGNNDWTVINEIHVREQVGTNIVQTAQIIQFQNDSYDVPNYFRPIIKNASNAFAFSIYYVMKFFNKASSEQIIRTANITSYDPKKYGLGLIKINIDENIQPLKVYNKVINLKRMQTSTVSNSKPLGITTKFVDVFIDKYNIAANTEKIDASPDSTFYGQAQLRIYLSKFDNVIKFKLVKHVNTTYIPVNVSSYNLYMNFILDNGQTLSIPIEKTNQEAGEFKVLVKRDDAQKILKQKNDHNFYIVSKTGTTSIETVIYTGIVRDSAMMASDLSSNYQSLTDYFNKRKAYLDEYERRLKLDHAKCEAERARLSKLARDMQNQLNAIKAVAATLPAAAQQQIKAALPNSIQPVETTLLVNELDIVNNNGTPTKTAVVSDNKLNTKTPPGGDNTQTNKSGGNNTIDLSKLTGLAGLAGLCGS